MLAAIRETGTERRLRRRGAAAARRSAAGRVAMVAAAAGAVAAGAVAGPAAAGAGVGPAGSVSAPQPDPAVIGFGDAASHVPPVVPPFGAPMAGIAATGSGIGAWLVGEDGGVFNGGNAGFYGSGYDPLPDGLQVGLSPTPDSRGYWIASYNGGVTHFGDASAPDSAAAAALQPAAPIVGIAADPAKVAPADAGYWLAGADGGVFSFGDGHFYGSMGGRVLDAPVVGMAATPDGRGYWLVAADGGVFAFGDAGFHGSMAGQRLDAPVVGIAASPDGRGYWLAGADGGVFAFGDAAFHGSAGPSPAGNNYWPPASTIRPVVGIAATADGGGYWLAETADALPPAEALPSVIARCNQAAEDPAVRPVSIMLACGDGNAYLAGLSWTSWSATSASGTGQYVHNLCVPDCARGTFVSAPATVSLSYPVRTGAGRQFAAIELSYPDLAAPHGRAVQRSVIAVTHR